MMRLFSSRIMCHDDIRAIRAVYGLNVKRENIKYDHVCRRDFPMNQLQKRFVEIHRWIHFYGFRLGSLISFVVFLITMISILLRRHCSTSGNSSSRSSIQSDYSEQSFRKQHKSAINAFLWHDDLVNG